MIYSYGQDFAHSILPLLSTTSSYPLNAPPCHSCCPFPILSPTHPVIACFLLMISNYLVFLAFENLSFHYVSLYPDMKEIILCQSLSLCLILCSTILSRSIHEADNFLILSFLVASSIVYMYHRFFIQSRMLVHLGYFQIFMIMDSAARNIGLLISFLQFLGHLAIPQNVEFLGQMQQFE